MQLDKNDLIEIAKALDRKYKQRGIAAEAAKSPELVEIKRSIILDMLGAARDAATIAIALKFVLPAVNSLLRGVDPKSKDREKNLNTVLENLNKDFVEPLKENAGKAQVIISAIVDRIKDKLPK